MPAAVVWLCSWPSIVSVEFGFCARHADLAVAVMCRLHAWPAAVAPLLKQRILTRHKLHKTYLGLLVGIYAGTHTSFKQKTARGFLDMNVATST